MKRLGRALIRLYPAKWRERYGKEFEALLEDSPPNAFGVFDLLKGAIRMQFKVPAFPKLALLLSIAGLLAGLGVSFVVTPRYVSQAEMQIDGRSAPPDSRRNLTELLLQFENGILSRTSLSAIIQDPRLDLYKSERQRIPLEDVIESMRRDITIRIAAVNLNRDSVAFSVAFTYTDRIKAQQTVQALITRFIDENLTNQRVSALRERGRSYDQVDRMEQRIAAIEKHLGISTPPSSPVDLPVVPPDGVELNVLDPPSLAARPVYPNRSTFMLTGFGAGFVSALLVAIFRRKLPPIPYPAQTV